MALTPNISPVVDRVLKAQGEISQGRKALPWALINIICAFAVYIDVNDIHILQRLFFSILKIVWTTVQENPHASTAFWAAEVGFITVMLLNTITNVYLYLKPKWMKSYLDLSSKQKRLLAVPFSDSIEKSETSAYLPSPISKSFNFSMNVTSSPILTCGASSAVSPSSARIQSLSPGPLVTSSPLQSSGSFSLPSCMLWSSYSTSTAPQKFADSVGDSQLGTSMNISLNQSGDGSRLRNRSFPSPQSKADLLDVTNSSSLERYLKLHEQKEAKFEATESPPNLNSLFLNWGGAKMTDFSPMFRKYTYQLASRSSQSAASRSDDDPDSPAHRIEDEVWTKFGITHSDLYHWTKNLRQWLTMTVLNRLVTEIKSINETLCRIGSPDLQIGEVGLTSLRHVCLTKSQFIPTLPILLPYLDVTAHQEYLVQRLKDLANGGCMSDFVWNGGGKFKGKPWADHLPTDAAIVMHLFCTYLDSRLPHHPSHPDGKTFTNQCFVRTPEKPVLNKDSLCIYQTRINPPHYKLVIEEQVWDLAKGRSNMFHTILLFLYHIKTKENGMFGRINFGLSGINVLCILD